MTGTLKYQQAEGAKCEDASRSVFSAFLRILGEVRNRPGAEWHPLGSLLEHSSPYLQASRVEMLRKGRSLARSSSTSGTSPAVFDSMLRMGNNEQSIEDPFVHQRIGQTVTIC